MALCWKYWAQEVQKDHAAKQSLKHLTEQVFVIPHAKVNLKVNGATKSVLILLDDVAYFQVDSKGCHPLRTGFYDVKLPCYNLYKELMDEKLISGLTQWNTRLLSKIQIVRKSTGKGVSMKQVEFRFVGLDIYVCKGSDMLFKLNGKRGCQALQQQYDLRIVSRQTEKNSSCIISCQNVMNSSCIML